MPESELPNMGLVQLSPKGEVDSGGTLSRFWNTVLISFLVRSSGRSLLFFVPYFPARLDFPSPPLSAPGSPRMVSPWNFSLKNNNENNNNSTFG